MIFLDKRFPALEVPLSDHLPLSKAFRERACFTFSGALSWLQEQPYGSGNAHSVTSVFEVGRGTCTTKHALAAALALELQLNWSKYIVYYRLDESIYSGAGSVLNSNQLSFLPARHCILGDGMHFIDLTHGNQHGKLKDLCDFDLFFKVEPLPGEETLSVLAQAAHAYYSLIEPRLSSFSTEDFKRLRKQIH